MVDIPVQDDTLLDCDGGTLSGNSNVSESMHSNDSKLSESITSSESGNDGNLSESNTDESSHDVVDSSEDENSSMQESNEEGSSDTDQQIDIPTVSCKHTTSDFDHALSIGLLSIMDKHSLSYACVTDMLKLFQASQPGFSLSLHMLLKKYVQPKDSLKFHHCCSVCMKFLESATCCNIPECKAKGLSTSSFIEVRLDYQL